MLVLAVSLAAATAWGTARNVKVARRSSYVDVLLHTLNLQASPEDSGELVCLQRLLFHHRGDRPRQRKSLAWTWPYFRFGASTMII
jgi:hypothetical protein